MKVTFARGTSRSRAEQPRRTVGGCRLTSQSRTEVEELGLTMRVQRAGDVVPTRPVFAVLGERAYTLWDVIRATSCRSTDADPPRGRESPIRR